MICEHILISAYVFLYGAEGFIILFVETELSHAKIILENKVSAVMYTESTFGSGLLLTRSGLFTASGFCAVFDTDEL